METRRNKTFERFDHITAYMTFFNMAEFFLGLSHHDQPRRRRHLHRRRRPDGQRHHHHDGRREGGGGGQEAVRRDRKKRHRFPNGSVENATRPFFLVNLVFLENFITAFLTLSIRVIPRPIDFHIPPLFSSQCNISPLRELTIELPDHIYNELVGWQDCVRGGQEGGGGGAEEEEEEAEASPPSHPSLWKEDAVKFVSCFC